MTDATIGSLQKANSKPSTLKRLVSVLFFRINEFRAERKRANLYRFHNVDARKLAEAQRDINRVWQHSL